MQALSEEADADFTSFDAEQLPPAKAEEAKNAIANMLRAEIFKVRTVPILQVRFRGSSISADYLGPHRASPSGATGCKIITTRPFRLFTRRAKKM
jgi:hypothetical protein